MNQLSIFQKLKCIFKYRVNKQTLPNMQILKFESYNKNIPYTNNLRNRYNFATTIFKTQIGKKHSYNDTQIWNNLPRNIKEIHSLKLFNKKLYEHILNMI